VRQVNSERDFITSNPTQQKRSPGRQQQQAANCTAGSRSNAYLTFEGVTIAKLNEAIGRILLSMYVASVFEIPV